MVSRRCALRGCALTVDNDTEEHIIPNAIGGRKKVRGFICRSCNNDTGSEWDDELARQLKPLSIYLGIKRQRGSVPSHNFPTASGLRIQVNADGTMTPAEPKIAVTTEGNSTRISVAARSRKELRQVLKGFQRKYPKIQDADIDKAMHGVRDNFHYSNDPIGIEARFGGVRAGRSLVKSALALVFDAGIDPSQCDLALNYLRNEEDEACFGYYYVRGRDLVVNRPAKLPFHCVHVVGCSTDSTMLGYIEFYGVWRMVLCLSETYVGKDFSRTYAIDPTTGGELDIVINLDLPVSEIREAYKYRRYDEAVFREAFCDVMDTVMEVGFRRELDRTSERAITAAYAKSGVAEGDPVTEELAWQLAEDITAEVLPFVIHNLTPPIFPKDIDDER